MLEPGQSAPDFTLPDQDGHEVSLSGLRGQPVVLYFYPKAGWREAYGVWVQKSMYGRRYMGVERSTFVIGPDGVIKEIFRRVKPAQHDELVLGALQA